MYSESSVPKCNPVPKKKRQKLPFGKSLTILVSKASQEIKNTLQNQTKIPGRRQPSFSSCSTNGGTSYNNNNNSHSGKPLAEISLTNMSQEGEQQHFRINITDTSSVHSNNTTSSLLLLPSQVADHCKRGSSSSLSENQWLDDSKKWIRRGSRDDSSLQLVSSSGNQYYSSQQPQQETSFNTLHSRSMPSSPSSSVSDSRSALSRLKSIVNEAKQEMLHECKHTVGLKDVVAAVLESSQQEKQLVAAAANAAVWQQEQQQEEAQVQRQRELLNSILVVPSSATEPTSAQDSITLKQPVVSKPIRKSSSSIFTFDLTSTNNNNYTENTDGSNFHSADRVQAWNGGNNNPTENPRFRCRTYLACVLCMALVLIFAVSAGFWHFLS
jgi:hypothetical protein